MMKKARKKRKLRLDRILISMVLAATAIVGFKYCSAKDKDDNSEIEKRYSNYVETDYSSLKEFYETQESDGSLYYEWFDRELTPDELFLLEMVTCGEAGTESYEGKVAVVAVVLNRVENTGFPNSIKDVIFDEGQFSSVKDGIFRNSCGQLFYEDISEEKRRELRTAVMEAVYGRDPTQSPVGGALYFYNPKYCSTEELEKRESVNETVTIGNHVFYREWPA